MPPGIDEESALHVNPQSSPKLEEGSGRSLINVSNLNLPPVNVPGVGGQSQQQPQHILPSTRASITIKNNNINNQQQQQKQKPPPKLLHP
jgi:hypothetical protein